MGDNVKTKKRGSLVPIGGEVSLDAKVLDEFTRVSDQANEAAQAKRKRQKYVLAVAQHHGFEKWQPPAGDYPTEVISMDEFRSNPGAYVHKLTKGMMNFPVGLNFSQVSGILNGMSHNACGVSARGLTFDLARVVKAKTAYSYHDGTGWKKVPAEKAHPRSHLLYEICRKKGLKPGHTEVDPIQFLTNYDSFVSFVREGDHLKPAQKEKALSVLQMARFIYLTALEVVGQTRVQDPQDLIHLGTSKSIDVIAQPENRIQALKRKIKGYMLDQPAGMGYGVVQNLLPISSVKEFQRLAHKKTLEILAKQKGHRVDPATELAGYSVGRSIFLACYFARSVIENYENHDDGVERVFTGRRETKMSGKCSDYTALAVHFLNKYVKPMHPDKFKGWHFGAQLDRIGDFWHHAYFKAVHVNPDQTVDVYFLDPTALSHRGIKELQTPQAIAEYAKTNNHPVLIKRNAEDLLRRKK